jgi:hypothetical protein
LGGFQLLEKKVEPELKPPELSLWLHLLVGKAVAPPPHMLQYGAAPLSKCLVGLQHEPPKKPELKEMNFNHI